MADASKISFGGTTYDLKDAAARVSLADKLDKVTTMPSTPTDGQVVMFVGATTATYTKGHFYQYQTSAWVDITPAGGGGAVDQTYDPTSANAQSGKAVAQAVAFKYTDARTYYAVQNMARDLAVTTNRFNYYFGVPYESKPDFVAVLIRGTVMPVGGTPVPFYYCVQWNTERWVENNDSNFLASQYLTINKNLSASAFSVVVSKKSGVSSDVYFAGTIELCCTDA